jgi:tRNA-splicing ligase RtcB
MKPHRIFSENIESLALTQFYSALKLDCVERGALMPDAHLGYSLPIGGVVATRGMIFPSWVGYDIGCGMCAVKTVFAKAAIQARAQAIFREVERVVPVGLKNHKTDQDQPADREHFSKLGQKIYRSRKGARQLGTLGGGNHFIEIGANEKEEVWLCIHSGSRGVGHGLATEYMRLASGGKVREGHFGFREDTELGKLYIQDMNAALAWALQNRLAMLKAVTRAIQKVLEGCEPPEALWREEVINRNHNHAEKRADLWIHRKGATHAEAGMLGVIPGNMRDGFFVVRGKGNPEALYSSSHGAGRVLSRKKAKKSIEMKEFSSSMEGITARIAKTTLDEAPMAYKDIFSVMQEQSSLVDIVDYVKPLINIKG